MIYGYCRISTAKQDIERQVRNVLERYPTAKIYKEIYTGTKKTGRKELERILRTVSSGDTIVFDSVSRMSRNADEGVELYFQLYEQGVNLVFLKEPHIDTDTYRAALQTAVDSTGNEIADIYIEATNKVLKLLAEKQIALAFQQAQKEVDDLRRRTAEGMQTARLHGKQIGGVVGRRLTTKKSLKAKELILKHAREYGGSLSDSEVRQLCGISRNSFYKYKRELKEDEERGLR